MGYKHYKEVLAEHSAIFADQYALTMSQAFFSNDKHNLNTTFHAYIRKNPFDGGYLVTGGQNIALEWLVNNWKFDEQDIEMMREETIPDLATGQPTRLYTDEFIDFIKDEPLRLTVDAMPEGELAFPDEPIYRIHGPLWQCLMVEAAILNMTNSQSLFATLATRLKTATGTSEVVTFTSDPANRDPILEFGLRRAQCIGGLEPTRGAYLGGIDGTSNMLAKKYYGIPTSGTFAHALVMTYEDELEAFSEYAQAMPNNGIFLVDTYNTLEGVKKAIKACKDNNVVMKGIRLDSGDLAHLSKEARTILDEAGFKDAKIAASNDLDEAEIISLKSKGAKIDIWGIGTNLATSKAQPALGAVYKLGAVFDGNLSQSEIEATRKLIQKGQNPANQNFVRNVIKLAEKRPGDVDKTTIPGELDILRFVFEDASGNIRFDGDTIISTLMKDPVSRNANKGHRFPDVLAEDIVSVRKDDDTLTKTFRKGTKVYKPLQRFIDQGNLVGTIETVHEGRARVAQSLAMLEDSHKALKSPHPYIAGIESDLFDRRKATIRRLRSKSNTPSSTPAAPEAA